MTRHDVFTFIALSLTAIGALLFGIAMHEYFDSYEFHKQEADVRECYAKGGEPIFKWGKIKGCEGVK